MTQEPIENPSALTGNEQTDVQIVAEPVQSRQFQTLDPRQITVSRIVGMIFAAIISLVILVAIVITLFVFWLHWIWFLIAGLGVFFILFLCWISYVWPKWEFDQTSWHLGENGLEIHRGVFWRHRISIPVARVQHADVSQGPLQRRFELGRLTVHTAGTQNASVDLEGIAHSTAIELRDKIVNQRKSVDVV